MDQYITSSQFATRSLRKVNGHLNRLMRLSYITALSLCPVAAQIRQVDSQRHHRTCLSIVSDSTIDLEVSLYHAIGTNIGTDRQSSDASTPTPTSATTANSTCDEIQAIHPLPVCAW